MLKNQERSLGMRRSSRSEVEVYFQVLEWLAEVRRDGGLFIAPTDL
jgi:hypothetical protein